MARPRRLRKENTQGFNEAPANLPGKSGQYDNLPVEIIYASMRPRRICRGNHPRPGWAGRKPRRASMRPRRICRGNRRSRTARSPRFRGFNEAPANLPGKSSRDIMADAFADLHGFNEAPANLPGKSSKEVSEGIGIGLASMRPRRICRGNLDKPLGKSGKCVASMRPRRICRGNVLQLRNSSFRKPGFNEAPANLPGKYPEFLDTVLTIGKLQ